MSRGPVGASSHERTHRQPKPKVTIIDRLRIWLFAAPAILALTVVFGTASLVGSVFDPSGQFQHWCARGWGRFVLRVAGVRLRVHGLESLESTEPCILCANHQSDMDIPVLLAALPFPFRFAAKKSLFAVPFLGWHLRRAGHVAIDRENPRAALRALDETVPLIRSGWPVLVFPEGRISRDGALGEFRRGAFLLAERTGASLVPIAIAGTREVLEPSSWILRNGDVEVTVGPALPSKNVSTTELGRRLRQYMLDGNKSRS